ncbi:MAG: DUF192 domain-containing protein [Alphaproteobacteria bacterium]|nr:DUF192 domain-containing protein [Alphaproteobacteria bacterium]
MNALRLCATLMVVACSSSSRLPVATIDVKGHSLTVEVAASQETRAQGLMHRDSLGAERGMIFVYDDDAPRRFWMKDTRIPLSIAFIDKEGTIVRIADMAPLTTDGTPSLYPARYALEVNKGWFAAKGVTTGDRIGGLDTLPQP